MTSRQAIEKLKAVGFVFVRMGKGDHAIYKKEKLTIIIPMGGKELSLGLSGKVRNYLRKVKGW